MKRILFSRRNYLKAKNLKQEYKKFFYSHNGYAVNLIWEMGSWGRSC